MWRVSCGEPVGEAYNNAMAESFFASLEGELITRNSFQSKTQARMAASPRLTAGTTTVGATAAWAISHL